MLFNAFPLEIAVHILDFLNWFEEVEMFGWNGLGLSPRIEFQIRYNKDLNWRN